MEKLFERSELSDSAVKQLLEHSGYITKTEVPSEDVLIYESEGNLFELAGEFIEKGGEYFIPVKDMSDTLFESVKDNADPIRRIELEGGVFTLSESIEMVDGEPMVCLIAEEVESEEDESNEITINEETFKVVDEEDATSYAYIYESEDGEYFVVDDKEESDFVVYLKEQE